MTNPFRHNKNKVNYSFCTKSGIVVIFTLALIAMKEEKTHHHFVPQVYLRKFHTTKIKKGKKDKYFVFVLDKIEDNSPKQLDIKDICAKNKLYTVDSQDKRVRESIENFYSLTLEKNYNRFYKLLTNSNKSAISLDERELIITIVINLYLRNYFWLKRFNNFWDSLISDYSNGFSDKVYDSNKNLIFDFTPNTKEETINNERQRNKQVFLKSHLEGTLRWVKFHFHDIIFVNTISKDSFYLTSDNPVIAGRIDESIRLPIDSNHLVTLLPPPSINDRSDYKLFRKENDFFDFDTTNMMTFENAERMVISKDIDTIERARENYKKATKR